MNIKLFGDASAKCHKPRTNILGFMVLPNVMRHPLREPVRLIMHLNEGYTQVLLERTEGLGMANGGIVWDIPTEAIPIHLRGLGSRFVVVTEAIRPEARDTASELRNAIFFRVETLEAT